MKDLQTFVVYGTNIAWRSSMHIVFIHLLFLWKLISYSCAFTLSFPPLSHIKKQKCTVPWLPRLESSVTAWVS